MMVTQGLLSHYYQFIAPDIVFYIDINAKIGLQRSMTKKSHREGDVYEKEDKLTKVVKGYRWLVKTYKDEFVVINGERSVEEVFSDIVEKVT